MLPIFAVTLATSTLLQRRWYGLVASSSNGPATRLGENGASLQNLQGHRLSKITLNMWTWCPLQQILSHTLRVYPSLSHPHFLVPISLSLSLLFLTCDNALKGDTGALHGGDGLEGLHKLGRHGHLNSQVHWLELGWQVGCHCAGVFLCHHLGLFLGFHLSDYRLRMAFTTGHVLIFGGEGAADSLLCGRHSVHPADSVMYTLSPCQSILQFTHSISPEEKTRRGSLLNCPPCLPEDHISQGTELNWSEQSVHQSIEEICQ